MTKRNIHYEAAFEDYLRKKEIPYIAINEAKRPIVEGKPIKNFDFIVYSNKGENLLVDIKGKYFPYESWLGKNYWENWIGKDDLEGLRFWQDKFGKGFKSVIVYPYYIKHLDDCSKFSVIHNYKRVNYGLVAITLDDYAQNCKPRSASWDAICVSREIFPRLVKPLTDFI